MQQIQAAVELASEYDILTSTTAWEKVVKFAMENVQGEIADATKFKYQPEELRIRVLVWNAKRDLLDSIIGHIDAVQRERDRIVAEFKETQDVNTSNGN